MATRGSTASPCETGRERIVRVGTVMTAHRTRRRGPSSTRSTALAILAGGYRWLSSSRHPVENVLELLGIGMSIDDVLADYEDLDRDDVLAAFEFGALSTKFTSSN